MVFDPEEYDSWYDRHHDLYLAELEAIKRFSSMYSSPKLEIGVGTGRFAGALNIEYGIDPDVNMLEFAKKRGVKAIVGKGEKIPFPDGFFAMVLISTTLPFFDDPAMVIDEVYRVLRHDGGLILAFIPGGSPYGRKYESLAKNGDKRFEGAHFYRYNEVKALIRGKFEIAGIVSTLIGDPPRTDIVEGYVEDASFVVLNCRKIQRD